jgi:hypothetical protein
VGVYVISYLLESQGRGKKDELVFCGEEDQENNFLAPFLFPSPSFYLYANLFFYNNFEE